MASWHHWAHQASQRCKGWRPASRPQCCSGTPTRLCTVSVRPACLAFLPSGLPCACRVGAVLAPGPKGSSGGVCGAFPEPSSLWLCVDPWSVPSFPHSLVKGTGSFMESEGLAAESNICRDSQGRSGGCVCRPFVHRQLAFQGGFRAPPHAPTLGVLRLSDLLSHFAGEGVFPLWFFTSFPLRAGIEHLLKTHWSSLVGCHFRSCAH